MEAFHIYRCKRKDCRHITTSLSFKGHCTKCGGKTLEVYRRANCTTCNGNGVLFYVEGPERGKPLVCSLCNGTGLRTERKD